MKRIRRRNRFFDVRLASGPPATSNCGWASRPKWLLAFGTSMPSGEMGGAKGTYGLSDAGLGVAGAAAGARLVGATGSAGASGLAVVSSDLSDLGFCFDRESTR